MEGKKKSGFELTSKMFEIFPLWLREGPYSVLAAPYILVVLYMVYATFPAQSWNDLWLWAQSRGQHSFLEAPTWPALCIRIFTVRVEPIAHVSGSRYKKRLFHCDPLKFLH